MQIEHLSVRNFRAFERGAMTFSPTGLAVVVGPNNAGKSAFLSALDVLAGERLPAPFHHIPRIGTAQVVATFVLSDHERSAILGGDSPWLPTSVLRKVLFAFIESYDQPGAALCAAIGFSPPDPDATAMWSAAVLLQRSLGDGELRVADVEQWFRSHTVGSDWDQPILANQGGVMGREFILTDPRMQPFARLLEKWRSTYYHFRALRVGTDRVRPLKSDPTLLPSGVNLTEALLFLNTQGDRAWETLRQLVGEALPDVGRLETPTSGSEVEIAFWDPALRIRQNIKDLGTGVEQLLMTAFVGLTRPEASLIVIEEPETNLHPGAQRVLLRYLKEWSVDKQFVVSTHSSTILNAGAGVPVWTIQRHEGASTIVALSSDLRPALDALGANLTDVLSASHLLILEGQSDIDVLAAWFSPLSSTTSTAVLPGGGGDSAWQVRVLRHWLELSETLPRKILFVRDRDELSPEAVEELDATGVVHVLHRRELENYLLEPTAIHSVLVERCAAAGVPCIYEAPADVAAEVHAAADSLRNVVLVKRVAGAMKPVRLLSRADVARVVDAGASLDELCRVAEANVPPASVIDDLRRTWQREEALLARSWESSRLEIAPGADILAGVWKKTGLNYSKAQDGVPLATRIQPPDEIAARISSFLADP